MTNLAADQLSQNGFLLRATLRRDKGRGRHGRLYTQSGQN